MSNKINFLFFFLYSFIKWVSGVNNIAFEGTITEYRKDDSQGHSQRDNPLKKDFS